MFSQFGTSATSSNSNFVAYLNGIYVTVNPNSGGDGQVDLDLTNANSALKIYFRSNTLTEIKFNVFKVKACSVALNQMTKWKGHNSGRQLLKKMTDYVTENKLEDVVGFEGQEDMVDVKATFCFERCDRGPVLRVNGHVLEHATFPKAKELLDREIQKIGQLLVKN